ncbi:MAG: 4Fe-4S binding protein [Candidatus Hodarchaeota archaeon]
MSFPGRIKEFKPPSTYHYSLKLLNHERTLEYNNKTCVACGICTHVCPIEGDVIVTGDSGSEKIKVDVEKCVHCGTCAYFCTSGALKLFINGEERIEIREPAGELERHSLPDFKPIMLTQKDTGAEIKKYLTGSLNIPPSLDKASVQAAVKACPTGALSEKKGKLVKDDNKCFYCDACSRETGGKITVNRSGILMEIEKGVPPLVKRVLDRLMGEMNATKILKGVSGAKGTLQTSLLMAGKN